MNNDWQTLLNHDILSSLATVFAFAAVLALAAIWITFPFRVLSRMSKMQASLDSIDKRLSGAVVTQES